jgi:hypothetical protein
MININNVPTEWVEQLEQKISWEEAVSIGLELRENKDNSQWNLGDLALKVEKSYGVDSLAKLAIEININKNSLSQYRRVSRAFPPETRSKILSHRHHLILAGQDDRFNLLRECEEQNITTSQLEKKYSRNPQEIMDHKEVLVCQKCQKLIVNLRDVCKCVPERPSTAPRTNDK